MKLRRCRPRGSVAECCRWYLYSCTQNTQARLFATPFHANLICPQRSEHFGMTLYCSNVKKQEKYINFTHPSLWQSEIKEYIQNIVSLSFYVFANNETVSLFLYIDNLKLIYEKPMLIIITLKIKFVTCMVVDSSERHPYVQDKRWLMKPLNPNDQLRKRFPISKKKSLNAVASLLQSSGVEPSIRLDE